MAQLRAALPWLQAQLPQLSADHGEYPAGAYRQSWKASRRIFFTEQQALGRSLMGCRCGSARKALQTNPTVASRLYATARDCARAAGPALCGSVLRRWGFGLHCATPTMRLTGIEIAPEAIACARQSAAQLGLSNLCIFRRWTPTQFATHEADAPQLVPVNPPRRGIGAELCDYLSRMAPPHIIYSSCNARTMATGYRSS